MRQMEFASNRCALTLTNSLELSLQMLYRLWILHKSSKWITTAAIPQQELAKLDTVRDLLLFYISDDCGQLRQALGFAVY